MPADHLTTTPASQIAAAVLSVLAGDSIDATAASHHLDIADLQQAIEVYQAGGLAALQRRAEQGWYQLLIQFPDWDTAESTAATCLSPGLERLQASHAITGWWFLRKHPSWRLRLSDANTNAVDQLLDELTTNGILTRWWPTIYEPETTAFGGPAGIHTAHELFCADSRGVLNYLRQPQPRLGRRELSLLLLNALLRAANLDWFERGDVFSRVAQLRPPPAEADHSRIQQLAVAVRALLAVPTHAASLQTTPGFAPNGSTSDATAWLEAFRTAGHQLGAAAANGTLQRGLRALLSHVVIFHWNRLGLSTGTQAILAQAAQQACLPQH